MGYTHILAFDRVQPERIRIVLEDGRARTRTGTRSTSRSSCSAFWPASQATSDLVTGILILPQRQTALVAKQAAAVDVLSGGQLRLGVGVGWNAVEFDALGENFKNRGKRIEEQIEVMRALWAKDLVAFDGNWHHIPDAGINPLPPQRPIPILDGWRKPDRARPCRTSGGWVDAPFPSRPRTRRPSWIGSTAAIRDARRDPVTFGIEGRLTVSQVPEPQWAAELTAWRAMRGITHLSVYTVGVGDLKAPTEHVRILERFAKETGPLS